MVVNDAACLLTKRSDLESIASKLAPTEPLTILFYARLSVQVWKNLAKVAIGTVRVVEIGKMD
ncbi:hypothetical protein DOZ80_20050 [Pseudomonas fluorescens]|uniref:Uncharacterized protein n=1 Tax=Pseudomonas fluorescens TaxID=294 RepID=A0A327MX90_PSEFL|nr:hypothetical protein [Pseudomonas fluorescens]RAI67132.1 hypothetical protein DOZ80_20050 [Pseudomonas fluorescens]